MTRPRMTLDSGVALIGIFSYIAFLGMLAGAVGGVW